MGNSNSNNNAGDQGDDKKGFAFTKNHLSCGCIDGELSSSICFREALEIFSEDNVNIGQLSVNIDKEKDTGETTYVIFVSLTEYIERFKHTNTVFGRVTHDFTTLEERRSDCLQLGEEKIERNVTLVNEGDEYCVSLSYFDGKEWERDSLEITKEDSLKLMGEAANYLYVRFLAQSGKCTAINFLSLLCDGSLHMSRYVSTPIGASKLGLEKREVCTMCVKRMLLNPKGKITAEWVLTKGAGYILEEKREIPPGSVVHPMMRYSSEYDASNESDDITEDEWNVLCVQFSSRGEKIAVESEDSRLEGPEADNVAETSGDLQTGGETEEKQSGENGKEMTPGEENQTSEKIVQERGPSISEQNCESKDIVSETPVDSEDAKQEEAKTSENVEDRRASKSDEVQADLSEKGKANGNLKPSEEEETSKELNRDDKSTETDPSREEERNSVVPPHESSELIVGVLTRSDRNVAELRDSKTMYENSPWPDASHFKGEVETIVVRAMDEILSGYEKMRRENAKLKDRMRKMSLEEHQLRRKLRDKDKKPHWKLVDGVRIITIHKKSSIMNDGKVDQSAIPPLFKRRDDQQLLSTYIDRNVCIRRC